MLVRGDQEVRPAVRTRLGVLNHPLAVLGGSLARHKAHEEAALGIDGCMVPVVTPDAVQWVVGVAVGLFLAHEDQ